MSKGSQFRSFSLDCREYWICVAKFNTKLKLVKSLFHILRFDGSTSAFSEPWCVSYEGVQFLITKFAHLIPGLQKAVFLHILINDDRMPS